MTNLLTILMSGDGRKMEGLIRISLVSFLFFCSEVLSSVELEIDR